MAFTNLFIRTSRSIGGVQLDGILTEGHDTSIRVTQNPIESGANVADHAVIEPDKVNIVAEVSDTPLGLAALGQIVDLVTGLFGSATAQNLTRSNAAYNALVQVQKAREPIEVQTKLKLYTNMLITGIQTTQDKDTSRIVRMAISLEEALITLSETFSVPASQLSNDATAQQASSALDRGRQEANVPTDIQQKSILKTVVDFF